MTYLFLITELAVEMDGIKNILSMVEKAMIHTNLQPPQGREVSNGLKITLLLI